MNEEYEKMKRLAPKGQIWICQACGKTAEDRYGLKGKYSYGWDESCMLNAILVDKQNIPKLVSITP